jgi:DNA uptake protein ComE-like DNA-binding protein
MPTPNERKGLWFLALVALSGTAVRVWQSRAPAPTVVEATALQRQLERVDSARSARQEKRSKRGTASQKAADSTTRASRTENGPVDLDRADAAAVETLPGVGPALARRIVAHRDSAGAFGGFGRLCEVRGIGPALAERLRPLVTFNGAQSPLSDACDGASKKPGKTTAPRGRERG